MKKFIFSLLIFLFIVLSFSVYGHMGMTISGGGYTFTPSDVPQSEADALIAFYWATGGPNWTSNSGWLSDPVVNNWYGIGVIGGHVVSINLVDNKVIGAVGTTLSPLKDVLITLYLYNTSTTINDITSLDVHDFTVIQNLRAYHLPNLTVLDVSSLTSLKTLRVAYCDLSVLDVSSLTSLTGLHCYGNPISILEPQSSVTDLRCHHSDLTSLDISGLSGLTYLAAGYTSITTLDASGLTLLAHIECEASSITSLTVSDSGDLTYLVGYANSMSESVVDDILCDLDTAGKSNGTIQINIGNAAPSAIGLACKSNLEGKGWTVTVSS